MYGELERNEKAVVRTISGYYPSISIMAKEISKMTAEESVPNDNAVCITVNRCCSTVFILKVNKCCYKINL